MVPKWYQLINQPLLCLKKQGETGRWKMRESGIQVHGTGLKFVQTYDGQQSQGVVVLGFFLAVCLQRGILSQTRNEQGTLLQLTLSLGWRFPIRKRTMLFLHPIIYCYLAIMPIHDRREPTQKEIR